MHYNCVRRSAKHRYPLFFTFLHKGGSDALHPYTVQIKPVPISSSAPRPVSSQRRAFAVRAHLRPRGCGQSSMLGHPLFLRCPKPVARPAGTQHQGSRLSNLMAAAGTPRISAWNCIVGYSRRRLHRRRVFTGAPLSAVVASSTSWS